MQLIKIGNVIGAILPHGVISCENFESVVRSTESLAVERQVLGVGARRRQAEFAAGRACARSALERLGYPEATIPSGRNREPIWPVGVVGSITHCEGYCAAAVASNRSFCAIGIDAEPNQPLPEGILELIAFTTELELLPSLPARPICWDRLIFCAKESLYKAWFPLERQWLGFDEARITLRPDNTFLVDILRPASIPIFLSQMTGRFIATETHLATSLVLSAIE